MLLLLHTDSSQKKRFCERRGTKPKTTLIEKVFILTFFCCSCFSYYCPILESEREQTRPNSHLYTLLNGKIIFHKLFDNVLTLSVVCVCVLAGNKAFVGDKINYKILHNKKLVLELNREEREREGKYFKEFLECVHKNSILFSLFLSLGTCLFIKIFRNKQHPHVEDEIFNTL